MFNSVLYPPEVQIPPAVNEAPEFFTDIGLLSILDGLRPYCGNMAPFLMPVTDRATLLYRQEIGKDLENITVRQRFSRLCKELTSMGKQLGADQADRLPYVYACRFVTLADRYIEQMQAFLKDLPYRELHSAGLKDFYLYVRSCLNRPEIARMRVDLLSIQREWKQLDYTLHLEGNSISAGPRAETGFMDEAVRNQFSAFRDFGASAPSPRPPAGESSSENTNGILSLLAERNPELFGQLLQFVRDNRSFADSTLLRAAEELPFYISWLDETDRLERSGCRFCYPEIVGAEDECHVENCFDMALARKLAETGKAPVTNEFTLHSEEHIVIITGPNQGGKTTFTRMLGQLFYLTSLGLRVPGTKAAIHPPRRIYTHFMRLKEDGAVSLRTDLQRLKVITSQADKDSMVLINEIFSSVPRCDGLYLGKEMLRMLDEIGCLTVCVTFLTELASYNEHTVSLKSRMGEGEKRTFRLERAKPDGLAHALSLAESKGLTYDEIRGRIQP